MFKNFYLKENKLENVAKPKLNKTVVDKLVEISKEFYSQNPTMVPQDLITIAIDMYLRTEMERIQREVDDAKVYATEEVLKKFPQKEIQSDINNSNSEETKNEK
jgi:hypothetical protein